MVKQKTRGIIRVKSSQPRSMVPEAGSSASALLQPTLLHGELPEPHSSPAKDCVTSTTVASIMVPGQVSGRRCARPFHLETLEEVKCADPHDPVPSRHLTIISFPCFYFYFYWLITSKVCRSCASKWVHIAVTSVAFGVLRNNISRDLIMKYNPTLQ